VRLKKAALFGERVCNLTAGDKVMAHSKAPPRGGEKRRGGGGEKLNAVDGGGHISGRQEQDGEGIGKGMS